MNQHQKCGLKCIKLGVKHREALKTGNYKEARRIMRLLNSLEDKATLALAKYKAKNFKITRRA